MLGVTGSKSDTSDVNACHFSSSDHVLDRLTSGRGMSGLVHTCRQIAGFSTLPLVQVHLLARWANMTLADAGNLVH